MSWKLVCLCMAMFILPGCMAETFLGDDEQMAYNLPEEFPKLQSIPERPKPDDLEAVKFDRKLAEESNKSDMEYNQELRERFGLPVVAQPQMDKAR